MDYLGSFAMVQANSSLLDCVDFFFFITSPAHHSHGSEKFLISSFFQAFFPVIFIWSAELC